jgi:hypothetical protein
MTKGYTVTMALITIKKVDRRRTSQMSRESEAERIFLRKFSNLDSSGKMERGRLNVLFLWLAGKCISMQDGLHEGIARRNTC